MLIAALLTCLVSILSTPKNCRYDPENPPKFTLWLNFLFSAVGIHYPDIPTLRICEIDSRTWAALFTVANLYYN